MTTGKPEIVNGLQEQIPGKRRQYTTEQKQRLLEEAAQPGNSISSVARRHKIAPNLMFRWKQLQDEGALAGLDANESVVAQSEVRTLKQRVRELERLLGKKTVEVEILQEAVEFMRGKGLTLPPSSSRKSGSR